MNPTSHAYTGSMPSDFALSSHPQAAGQIGAWGVL